MPISEQTHKHRCAVRYFLYLRGSMGLNEFRDWVKMDRVRPLWMTVQEDYIIQYRLGNRGNWGTWL